MPALQRGSTYPTANGRGIRWYENGQRRKRSGFRTDSEAFAWWDEQIAPRLRAGLPTRDVTLANHTDRFLDLHTGAKATRQALRERLGATDVQPHRRREREYKTALEVFGDRTLRELEGSPGEIAAWVASLPETQRAPKLKALRHVLQAAVDWGLMLRNPAATVKAPAVRPAEVEAFADTTELDLVAYELGEPWAQLVVLASETGLRPEEWAALERRDVDARTGVLTVGRAYTVAGGLKTYGKTSRSLRTVPLTDRALNALDGLPTQLRTPLLFPTYTGGGTRGEPGHLNLANWRRRHWHPALHGANLERSGALWLPKPYVLRHTFATWALDAGFEVWDLARLMGTSVAMIDLRYGHLAKGHAERSRDRLNRRPSIASTTDVERVSRDV